MHLTRETALDRGVPVVAPEAGRPGKPRFESARLFAAVFAAFAFFAVLSWESFGSWGGPSFFYPAAGVTSAAMMLSRRARWPWIVAAVVAAEILVDSWYSSPLWLAVAFAAANVVEPLIGATLVLTWCGRRPDLRVRADFFAFLLGACALAPVVGALIGGTASWRHNGTSWLSAAATWWAGDALGVLVMGAPILLWGIQSEILRRRPWETAGVLAVSAILSGASFWTEFPPSILVLPVLAWAAFRLDMLGAAIAGALAAFVANILSTHGEGLFSNAGLSSGARVGLTQIYVAVIVVVAMLIAQEAGARLRAVREREIERRERMRLETLARLGHRLAGALTAHDVGQVLVGEVLNEAGARSLMLALISADGTRLEWVTTAGYPQQFLDLLGDGMPLDQAAVLTDVARSGTPIEVRDSTHYNSAYPGLAELRAVFGAESIVGWPLSSGGQSFGALLLVWTERQPLDVAQRSYISAVATMVSQALVRAKVYADQSARAAVLHSVAQPEALVEAVGLDYRALYEPADAAPGLGGDWYTVMALPDDRTFLTVGDVIGHGLASVEDMATLRSTANAYAHLGLEPARLLAELNRFAGHQMQGEFATSLVAFYDPADRSLSYASAGHLPALLYRAGTGEVIRLSDVQGPMLGPFDDAVYTQRSVVTEPGDVLVMYTDGFVEHFDEDLREGIGHLEKVLASWPPAALLDPEALAADIAPAPRPDDLCLLTVRFR